jgi:hypothetical protein
MGCYWNQPLMPPETWLRVTIPFSCEIKIGLLALRRSGWLSPWPLYGSHPRPLSAPEEIRTPNLLIRSQMLYPLSYGRMCSII